MESFITDMVNTYDDDRVFFFFVVAICLFFLVSAVATTIATFKWPKIMLPFLFANFAAMYVLLFQPYKGDVYFIQTYPKSKDPVRVDTCDLMSRRNRGIAGYCEFRGWVSTRYSPMTCVPVDGRRDSCG